MKAPSSTCLASRSAARQRGRERVGVGGADERAGAGEQLLARAVGDDPAVADDHELVGDRLDLVAAGARTGRRCRRGRRSRAAAARIQRMPSGSRPLAGSSRISTSGSPSSACASPSRWRMPSEYWRTRLRAADLSSPTSVSSSSTRSRVDAHHLRADGERLAAAAAGVLGAGVEQDADAAARVLQGVVVAARARSSCRRRARRARRASASWWSCRRRSVRGTRSRCRARSGTRRR